MTSGLIVMLLVFSGVAFAGAGAALAVLRQRRREQEERDFGLATVVGLLATFGALCALLGAGFASIFGFGGVVFWLSYVLTAQRVGLFRIESVGHPYPEEHPGEAWRT